MSEEEHRYTSTACQHKLHKECRMRCKFCNVLCLCFCHNSLRRSARMLEKLEELV
jgi:hypothetical protein